MKRLCRYNSKSCKLSATKDGYCHIHYKLCLVKKHVQLEEELRETKQKLEEELKKLELINHVDWLRQGLHDIGGKNRSLKLILSDTRYKRQIEGLLGVPFSKARKYFFSKVDERNKLCHPFTMNHIWA